MSVGVPVDNSEPISVMEDEAVELAVELLDPPRSSKSIEGSSSDTVSDFIDSPRTTLCGVSDDVDNLLAAQDEHSRRGAVALPTVVLLELKAPQGAPQSTSPADWRRPTAGVPAESSADHRLFQSFQNLVRKSS